MCSGQTWAWRSSIKKTYKYSVECVWKNPRLALENWLRFSLFFYWIQTLYCMASQSRVFPFANVHSRMVWCQQWIKCHPICTQCVLYQKFAHELPFCVKWSKSFVTLTSACQYHFILSLISCQNVRNLYYFIINVSELILAAILVSLLYDK